MFGSMEDTQRMLEADTQSLHMHSDECRKWRAEHNRCQGCDYELECRKLSVLGIANLLIITSPITPATLTESISIHRNVLDMMEKALHTDSMEELTSIGDAICNIGKTYG